MAKRSTKRAEGDATSGVTMRVEILEPRLSDTDPDTDRHYLLEKGDRITVPIACGQRWCSYGWAKDLAGKHETGERIEGTRAPLEVHDGTVGGK